MLKVKSIKPTYLKYHIIGKKVMVITLDYHGFESTIEELLEQCSPFDTILIKSNQDVFEQIENLSKLLKEIQKINPFVNFMIETDAKTKPKYLTTIRNLLYVVKLKHDFVNDMDDKVFKYLAKADTKFIVELKNIEKLDDVVFVLKGLDIKNKSVFFDLLNTENFKKDSYIIFTKGYNIFVEYTGDWFESNK